MKYALIGCGRISPNHIESAHNNNLDFVAMADINSTAIEEKITRFNLSSSVHCYTDYHELLTKECPSLVAIATPSGEHAKIALDAIDAGCHVIIEKPIALSMHDASSIIEAAKKKGVLVCANHQNRFNKSVQYIRKALEANRFGRLLHGAAHVRWNRQESYYTQALWRGTWAQDGGALMNQCIHNIDLLRWMMSYGSSDPEHDIDEVFAYTDQLLHPYLEAEDLGLALVRFTNGSYGLIEGTTNIYPRNLEETLYIFGEKGTIKAGGTSDNIIEEWSFADKLDNPEEVKKLFSENPPNIYGFGHTPLYANVINAIEGRDKLLVDGEAGKRALELVLAIYKSAAEGRPVKLPLDESVGTLDFVGRFDK